MRLLTRLSAGDEKAGLQNRIARAGSGFRASSVKGDLIVKRDNDLIRELLIEIEEHEGSRYHLILGDDSDAEDYRRHYHLELMADAGLVEISGTYDTTFRLTNYGHDFIEAIRDDNAWEAVKGAANKAGGVSLSLLADIGVALLKAKAAEILGVDI
jgi:hypothetical protein